MLSHPSGTFAAIQNCKKLSCTARRNECCVTSALLLPNNARLERENQFIRDSKRGRDERERERERERRKGAREEKRAGEKEELGSGAGGKRWRSRVKKRTFSFPLFLCSAIFHPSPLFRPSLASPPPPEPNFGMPVIAFQRREEGGYSSKKGGKRRMSWCVCNCPPRARMAWGNKVEKHAFPEGLTKKFKLKNAR